jgi:hypothetical protein
MNYYEQKGHEAGKKVRKMIDELNQEELEELAALDDHINRQFRG